MIVHKFGGTSVGDAGRMASVAEIIAASQRKGPTAVVVSAMMGTTNRLIAGARAAAAGDRNAARETRVWIEKTHLAVVEELLTGQEAEEVKAEAERLLDSLVRFLDSIAVLGELTARGHDAVVGFGERLSATLLAAALRCRGTRAEAITATELIVTDGTFGAAKPRMKATYKRMAARVRPLAEAGVVPVITGYIGATEDGVPTTLGRSGSDFSAAIVAACLEADELRIWTDVDGILTADPNVVPNARVLRELSYSEAERLARFGAEVLHPRTVGPVIKNGIPLRIVNSFNPTDPGTLIVERPSAERSIWPAIVSAAGLRLLRLCGGNGDWRLGSAIHAIRALGDVGIDVLMLSQSFSEQGINVVVREEDAGHAARLLSRDGGAMECADLSTVDVAAISVIGLGSSAELSIARRAFSALGDHDVPVLVVTQAATDESLSICVAGDHVADTVRFLHARLGLES
jgi:aspartate kinase